MSEQILLEIRAIAGDARRELAELARDIVSVGSLRSEAKVGVNTKAAFAKLGEFKAALLAIDHESVDVSTNIEIAETIVKIELLQRELRDLDGKKVSLAIRQGIISEISGLERHVVSLTRGIKGVGQEGSKLDAFFLRFGRAGAGSRVFSQIAKNIGDVVRQFPVVGTFISEIGQSILVFGNKSSSAFLSVVASVAAAGVAILGFVVVLNYLITLLSAVVALIGAVVASLALAAAGFGALAIGAAGALGPAILVLIVLFSRLNAIMQARQARETALKQAARDRNQEELRSIQTAERLRNAHKAVTDAENNLNQAHQAVKDAFKQGMQEMEDSALALKDALLGVEDAELGIADAQLGIREAEFALKKFRREAHLAGVDWADLLQKAENVDFNPERLRGVLRGIKTTGGKSPDEEQQLQLERLVLNVRRAKLQEQQANNTLTHSEVTLTRARQRNNEFVNRGVRAYKPYITALKQVRSASDRVREAEHDLASTQRQIRLEQTQNTSAMNEYLRQRSKLTDTEKKFLDNIIHTFNALKKLGGLFTDPIFRAANAVFDQMHGKTGFLASSLREVGKAFGDWVRAFGKFLGEPASRNAFQVMAHGASSLVRSLGAKTFIDFLRIMRNIATAVMPNLISKGNSISRTFKRWADGTSNIAELRKKLRPLIHEFDTWWDIIKLLAQDFIAFVSDAKGPARSISGSIKEWLTNLRKFLQSEHGRREVLRWIEKAKHTAVDFWNALKTIVHWLRVLGSAASDLLGPFGKLVDLLDKGSKLFDKLPGVFKLGPKVLKGVSPLNTLAKALHLPHLPFQSGGEVPGGPILSHPGEYMIRSAVATQMGRPFMDAFNQGGLTLALAGAQKNVPPGRRGDVHVDKIEVSSPDGGYPDGRHSAVMLAEELRRMGA